MIIKVDIQELISYLEENVIPELQKLSSQQKNDAKAEAVSTEGKSTDKSNDAIKAIIEIQKRYELAEKKEKRDASRLFWRSVYSWVFMLLFALVSAYIAKEHFAIERQKADVESKRIETELYIQKERLKIEQNSCAVHSLCCNAIKTPIKKPHKDCKSEKPVDANVGGS